MFLLLLVFFSSAGAAAKPQPGVSGLLSIVPGLGQVANGDTLEGVAWFSTTIGLLLVKDGTAREFGQNFWFYNMYDAYRDAGAKRAKGYSALENYIASFNPLNLVDPISVAFVGSGALSNGATKSNKGAPKDLGVRALYYSAVGWGEEGLFRGFLFSGLAQGFNSTWGGAILSSALFSAAHGEGGAAIVYRFFMGMLLCWQTHTQEYDLRHSIFAHTWYDFLLTRRGNAKGEVDFKAMVKHEWRF